MRPQITLSRTTLVLVVLSTVILRAEQTMSYKPVDSLRDSRVIQSGCQACVRAIHFIRVGEYAKKIT